MFRALLLICVVGLASAAGPADTNCTYQDGADIKYTELAVGCDNVLSDFVCLVLYTKAMQAATTDERNVKCFQDTTNKRNEEVVQAAVALCPKTCGYCCLTPAYNCRNKDAPRINCDTVTPTQCKSDTWKAILTEDCPATCGLCDTSVAGCEDIDPFCKNDPSICQRFDMQSFVRTNCRKTCGYCQEGGVTATPGCTDTINCASWVAKGFCTSTFYDQATKRAYCGRSCNLC